MSAPTPDGTVHCAFVCAAGTEQARCGLIPPSAHGDRRRCLDGRASRFFSQPNVCARQQDRHSPTLGQPTVTEPPFPAAPTSNHTRQLAVPDRPHQVRQSHIIADPADALNSSCTKIRHSQVLSDKNPELSTLPGPPSDTLKPLRKTACNRPEPNERAQLTGATYSQQIPDRTAYRSISSPCVRSRPGSISYSTVTVSFVAVARCVTRTSVAAPPVAPPRIQSPVAGRLGCVRRYSRRSVGGDRH